MKIELSNGAAPPPIWHCVGIVLLLSNINNEPLIPAAKIVFSVAKTALKESFIMVPLDASENSVPQVMPLLPGHAGQSQLMSSKANDSVSFLIRTSLR